MSEYRALRNQLYTPPPNPDVQRAAAITTAAHARDADDCRQLLDALGLTTVAKETRDA